MRNSLLSLVLILTISCYKEKDKPQYYKNLYTGEVQSKAKFEDFRKSLYLEHSDSTKKSKLSFNFYKIEKSYDSIIQPFKYEIRIGDKYLVRPEKYEKIGMKIPSQEFTSVDGKKVWIGGKQEKPTFINLWFVHCPGCVAEMPALNKLKEKYADKVNFIAMTFEQENDVIKFLNKRDFKFTHVVNVKNFIEQIGSYPYPENIFIDKNGVITNIEGGIPFDKATDLSVAIEYYESIIKKLL